MTKNEFLDLLEEYADLFEENRSIIRKDDYADISIRNQDRVFNRMRMIEDDLWNMFRDDAKE